MMFLNANTNLLDSSQLFAIICPFDVNGRKPTSAKQPNQSLDLSDLLVKAKRTFV
jgi:hypothetical protein